MRVHLNEMSSFSNVYFWCCLLFFTFVLRAALAFECLHRFVVEHCPQYVARGFPGAHRGVGLLGECLEAVRFPPAKWSCN